MTLGIVDGLDAVLTPVFDRLTESRLAPVSWVSHQAYRVVDRS